MTIGCGAIGEFAIGEEGTSGIVVNADQICAVEWTAGINANQTILAEHTLGIVVDCGTPFEHGALIYSDQLAAFESNLLVYADQSAPIEWTGSFDLEVDQIFSVEFNLKVYADQSTPVEYNKIPVVFQAGNPNIFKIDERGIVWKPNARGYFVEEN